MSKHTPGQWKAEVAAYLKEGGAAGHKVTAADGALVVGWCGEKDAHLIAAAPALLDELRDRYDMTKCGCGHWACARCRDDAVTLAVIREAQGETE